MDSFRPYLDLIAEDPATQKGKKIPERDIQTFEKTIGFSLPADYRNFLLRFGAGNFRFGRFRQAQRELTSHFAVDHDWISSGQAFVFAEDYGGNFYMLDYRTASDNPAVLFLDHEMDDGEDPHVIYDNFAEFIADHYGVDGQGRPSLNRKQFGVRVADIAHYKPGNWIKVPQLAKWDLQLKVLSSHIIPDPDIAVAKRPLPPDQARTFCFALYNPHNAHAFVIDPLGRHNNTQLYLNFANSKIYRDKTDSAESILPCHFTGIIERKIDATDIGVALPVFFMVSDTPLPKSAELELHFEISTRKSAR